MTRRTKILSLVGCYLPGYKAGGVLRTIANMVEHLSDEFEFWIVTRDRDLGDTTPYPNIKPNEWQVVGGASVYYLLPESCTINGMARLISTTAHDIIYLNSFFDPTFTLKPLLAGMLGWLPRNPIIVAPRGEFSSGALRLRYTKKLAFIKLVSLLGLYKNITWQASSEYEAQDISRVMHVNSHDIHVALDLPAPLNKVINHTPAEQTRESGNSLRLVFLSRISPKKNLDYALKVLSKVSLPVIFDIYGPAEDCVYWRHCQTLISELPDNVSVNFMGGVSADRVASIFRDYDLFFFPTWGENYGHVIAESLLVGTPVLISDQTPWRDLYANRLGWDVSLDDADCFVRIIEEYSVMTLADRNEWRHYIKSKIIERLTDPLVFEANRELFRRLMKK